MQMLKCPICNNPLKLDIAYSGCDWDTIKGQGSGYGWEVSLFCDNSKCGSLFTIGHIKNLCDFSELKPELKCVN
ncbi:hypothetical protein SDC9_15161 [bioreactor metagenome]|uniref:Uncharacterized protein n=1 Tax=bioreactor metagenome TaxID=1076179 RepID=A0A644TRZ3_9ZZZZ|nr:hypothetical protein [Desulfitobacterium hafniense]MEA5023913.1 hypothetical protein [Desulfitobacterium hafniense]